ncbi:MAG: DUF2764 family protein [Deltaproteobacteria bacterium]|nr:DUF2764 family protein [Deltaproteobacteria bacterium]
MGDYYFLMCLFPPLPSSLGDKPVMPFAEISRMAHRHVNPPHDSLLRAWLSTIDAANWENMEQGVDFFLEGGALTREAMEARQNLPPFIRQFMEERERGIQRPHIYDRLWELCYKSLLILAEQEGCRFLIDYVSWEIDLRNRLTALRLRDRGANAADHILMPGLGSFDFTALVSQLEGQINPLEAERIIDLERLKQICSCQGVDPFSLDAVLTYLACAAVYDRWEKLQKSYDIDNYLYYGG